MRGSRAEGEALAARRDGVVFRGNGGRGTGENDRRSSDGRDPEGLKGGGGKELRDLSERVRYWRGKGGGATRVVPRRPFTC